MPVRSSIVLTGSLVDISAGLPDGTYIAQVVEGSQVVYGSSATLPSRMDLLRLYVGRYIQFTVGASEDPVWAASEGARSRLALTDAD